MSNSSKCFLVSCLWVFINGYALADGPSFAERLNNDINNFHPNFYNYIKNPDDYLNPCGNPIASMSPDGSNVLLWASENSTFPFDINTLGTGKSIILIDGNCLKNDGDFFSCTRDNIGAINTGITHLYWSSNNRDIFFIDYSLNLRQARLDSNRTKFLMSDPVKLDDLWTYRDSLTILGATPNTDMFSEVSRIKNEIFNVKLSLSQRYGNDYFEKYRTTIGFTGALGSVAKNYSDQDIVLIDVKNGNYFKTSFLADELVMAPTKILRANQIGYMLQDANKAKYIIGGSSVLKFTQKNNTTNFIRNITNISEVGTRPIIDSKSGELIGVFAEKTISPINNKSIDQALLETIRSKIPNNEVLDDVQISSGAKVAFVISHDISKGAFFRYFRYDKQKINISTKFCPSDIPLSNVTEKTENIGTPIRPLFIRKYTRNSNNKLVVWLHGGPLTNISRDSQWNQGVRKLLLTGADVVMLGYSGTLDNAEIASRLRKDGGASLEQDAKVLIKYLNRQKSNYEEISLVGESFGGAVALPIIEKSDNLFSKIVLISPLAKLKQPKKMDYSGMPELRELAKAKYEKDTLWFKRMFASQEGSNTKPFADWLIDKYENIKFGNNTLIIQGNDDVRSLPEDILNLGSARRVVNNLGHSGVDQYLGDKGLVTEWLFGEKVSNIE